MLGHRFCGRSVMIWFTDQDYSETITINFLGNLKQLIYEYLI